MSTPIVSWWQFFQLSLSTLMNKILSSSAVVLFVDALQIVLDKGVVALLSFSSRITPAGT